MSKISINSFREITDLTDDEVKQITSDLFNPIQIMEINRDFEHQEIFVSFRWKWDEDEIVDEVIFSTPSIDNGGISADFTLNSEDYVRYNQFLIASGVNYYLKDNPYLEKQDDYDHEYINLFFGLSYASYLVLPRSILQSMPTKWQKDFVALLDELEDTCAKYGIETPDYTVHARKNGKFIKDKYSRYFRGARNVFDEVKNDNK